MKTIRLIELFAGYGSQAMALKRAGLPFEYWRAIENDVYCVRSYNAVHGTDIKPTDIKDVNGEDLGIVDRDKYNYFMTYSFPCTDLSKAGKRQGMKKGDDTRSGLLWEVERILKELGDNLPQFLMMENVIQVHSKFVDDFALWISFLDSLGYKSKWQVLNAKDYGVPQNRERVFMISWLESGYSFQFPEPKPLTKTIKDYLEEDVAEEYYLNTDKARQLIDDLITEGKIDDSTTGGGLDLWADNPSLIDTSFTIQTHQRGVSNHRGKETGVLKVYEDKG